MSEKKDETKKEELVVKEKKKEIDLNECFVLVKSGKDNNMMVTDFKGKKEDMIKAVALKTGIIPAFGEVYMTNGRIAFTAEAIKRLTDSKVLSIEIIESQSFIDRKEGFCQYALKMTTIDHRTNIDTGSCEREELEKRYGAGKVTWHLISAYAMTRAQARVRKPLLGFEIYDDLDPDEQKTYEKTPDNVIDGATFECKDSVEEIHKQLEEKKARETKKYLEKSKVKELPLTPEILPKKGKDMLDKALEMDSKEIKKKAVEIVKENKPEEFKDPEILKIVNDLAIDEKKEITQKKKKGKSQVDSLMDEMNDILGDEKK